jgi:hypothetical protein
MTFVIFSTLFMTVHAEDTEIFFSKSRVNSNVLFIIDNSGSMKKEVIPKDKKKSEITATVEIPTMVAADDAREYTGWSSNGDHDHDNDNGNQWKKTAIWDHFLMGNIQNQWNSSYRAGLHFSNVTIPKNAEILSAHIQFTAQRNNNNKADYKIAVQNDANPGAFEHGVHKDIAHRDLYNTEISWQPPAWTTNKSDDAQKTPDLKKLVQLVVKKPDWKKGNAMVFIINTKGLGTRWAYSANTEPNKAPVLNITYKFLGYKTRMQIMKNALKSVLDKAPPNLSVGIMNYGGITNNPNNWRFDRTNGIRFPVMGIQEKAYPILEKSLEVNSVTKWNLSNVPDPSESIQVGAYLKDIVDSWQPKGATPIVDALYEAARYYRGDKLYAGYGKARWAYSSHPATYTKPAPNLVEPILKTKNVVSCAGSPIEKKIWTSSIETFRNGNNNWYKNNFKCPADKNNPAGPGSYENCQTHINNPQNCKSGDNCRGNWIAARSEKYNCRLVDGVETDCKWRKIRGTGQCDSQGIKWYKENYCKIYTCVDLNTNIPAPHYNTPIISDCQSNNIILMSDGKPEYEKIRQPHAYSRIKELIGKGCASEPSGFKAGECGKELTTYLFKKDLNSTITGMQTVNTFVVGFASGITDEAEDYLKSLVTADDLDTKDVNEGYFSAKNGEDLAKAFTDTLKRIAKEARSQASPGYSVNVRSGLEHEDSIYIPVFDKSNTSVWSGNLKKFKLVDDKGHRHIRGKDTKTATTAGKKDAMTKLGLFTGDAWDFWSKSNKSDGDVVQKGGTASLLTNPRVRKLYSNISSSKQLTAASNHLKASNSAITKAMLFNQSALKLTDEKAVDYRKKLINYIRGWKDGIDGGWAVGSESSPKGFTESKIPDHARKHMGDMLHSEPVIITYNTGADSTSSKVQYVFASTNEGYLHVFDAETGEEKYAFMPKDLLKNINGQFKKGSEHRYGVDGSITYFHDDTNKDGNVNGTEKVYLYFGLRRGGRSYYALDISSKDAPELLWSVDNTTTLSNGSIASSEGFSRLGQSWSMPYLANVMHSGTKKRAVIFTGGNEKNLDYGNDKNSYVNTNVLTDRETQNMADDIYIVDAEDGGKLLWSLRSVMGTTGNNVIKHGLAGGVRILDVNGNGLLDRMYFADTGGNVWRLDLSETLSTDAKDSKLTKLASLASDGSGKYEGRKFYNEPDVASVTENGKTFFTVSIGSGLRPHPMNDKIKDHMFVLLDNSPFHKPESSYKTINMADLSKVEIKVTSTELGGGKTSLTKALSQDESFEGKKITDAVDSVGNHKRGWYIDFSKMGEKVLSASTTFEGSVIFTTLVPDALTAGENINACALPPTQGRIYVLNLLTGEPSANLDKDSDIDDQDIFETISASEIPGTPQLIFNKLNCANGSCKHEVDVRIGKKDTEVNTSNLSKAESIYWSDPVSN